MSDNKAYGIFRIEKVKLSDGGGLWGRAKHAFREFKNTSFDPELTKQNECYLVESSQELLKKYKSRITGITTDTYKPPKNAVGIYECIFTSTAGKIAKEQEKDFIGDCYVQLANTFGKENVLAGVVHRDETTVHMHWFVTPIYNTTSVLRRTREEKRLGTCRTITQEQLNATHWTGSPALLSELQDTMYEGVFKNYNLERGNVELGEGRNKKKRNVRSDLRRKQESLDFQEKLISKEKKLSQSMYETQKIKRERLNEYETSLNTKAADLKKQEEELVPNAVSKYESLTKSQILNNGQIDEMPSPESRETVWTYYFRIRPLWDAVVEKAKQFLNQVSVLKKEVSEKISTMKANHEAELRKIKSEAEAEKRKAVETAVKEAVQKNTEEKDGIIMKLEKTVDLAKAEKEKWYNILFTKFSYKANGKNVEVNKGLTEAFFDASKKLDEWEYRSGDELISIGNKYHRMKAGNWHEYEAGRERAAKQTRYIER